MTKKTLLTLSIFGLITITAYVAFAADKSLNVVKNPPCNNIEKIHAAYIEKSGIIEDVVNTINTSFKLPKTLTLQLACAEEDDGPYYDPEIRTIVIPYAFRAYVFDEFKQAEYVEDTSELDAVTDDVLLHTLYHELGHALIDVLQLPITGKEEDAVDELATLMLLNDYEHGNDIALSAGDFFAIESQQYDEVTEEDMFGEHSLDEQRFFNTICLIYGYNPEGEAELIEELEISPDRADLCIETYEKRDTAWQRILKPYIKSTKKPLSTAP